MQNDFGRWARLRQEAVDKLCAAHPGQDWIRDWVTNPMRPGPSGLEWIRTRPAGVHSMMIAFPPLSLVRARRPLTCPAPGQLAIVTAWSERSICVRGEPDGGDRMHCDPTWIEVAICRMPFTQLWMQDQIAGAMS